MSSAVVEMYRPAPSEGPVRARLRLVAEHERAPAAGPSGVHITRRGRLAVTGMVTLLLLTAMFSLLSALGPASATSAVVVEPGMTLSQIAADHLPGVPLSQAVSDIQRANKLSTTSIAVGQELLIPGR